LPIAKRIKIGINAEHAKRLMDGKPIAVKVPSGTEIVELSFSFPVKSDSGKSLFDGIAKTMDVFFNGRSA
jgi:hypothetical protein